MRYEVKQLGSDIEIHVSDAAGRTPQLLQSLQDCQAGHCDCPTDQYDKLGAMDIDAGTDQVRVRLEPLPGERLDPDQIQACLEYTTTHSEELEIVHGKSRIAADTALRLAKFFGTTDRFWLNLQTRLEIEKDHLGNTLDRIEPLKAVGTVRDCPREGVAGPPL